MIRRALTVLLLGAALAGGSAIADANAGRKVEIVSAEFGIFSAASDGKTLFQPSAVVPHAIGQRYGWIIGVRTAKRSLEVREEYVFAAKEAPPAESAVAANLRVPDLSRRQVSQRQLVPVDGEIAGEWEVGPAEPAGRRRLLVSVEGESRGFDFTIE